MASGTKTAASLPTFAHDWVGGDIHGLAAFAATLDGYVPRVDDVVGAVGQKVRATVSAEGWQGSAADAFEAAWQKDATAITALGEATGQTAGIADQLAATLAGIENALEQAASQAEKAGVPVGPDGTVTTAQLAGTAQQTAADYEAFRQQCLDAAGQARDQAAAALNQLYAQIAPPQRGLSASDYTSLADYLRGLWAIPTSYRKFIDAKIPGLERAANQARAAAREEARGPDGRFRPWTEQGRQQFADAKAELQSVEQQAAGAAARENLSTKIFGSGLTDVVDGSKDWGAAARFFGDIPFAGEGLAAVGAGLTIAGDRSAGESWGISAADGLTSNAAGLVAGEGAAGGFAAGATTVLGASATAAGVTVGALFGGVVAVGVGDLVHNAFQEHWGADIHQDGVLGGLGQGAADTVANTGRDLGHMAGSIWHGVSSIF